MYDAGMRLRTGMARSVWFGALAMFVGACLGEAAPGARTAPPVATGESPAVVDAGTQAVATSMVDAAVKVTDAGAHAWRNAASCAALQRSKALGCCNPSPEMLLCIVYNNANHVVGPYPARVLLVTATDTQRVVANVTLDLRNHGGPNVAEPTVGLLGLSVQPWGFELSALQGCGDAEVAATKRMCTRVGRHTWDGHKLVHEAAK